MKRRIKTSFYTFLVILSFSQACEEKNSDSSASSDCYTCDKCTGEYANILSGREYCVDGFDNKADWEANKNTQETDNGCTCE